MLRPFAIRVERNSAALHKAEADGVIRAVDAHGHHRGDGRQDAQADAEIVFQLCYQFYTLLRDVHIVVDRKFQIIPGCFAAATDWCPSEIVGGIQHLLPGFVPGLTGEGDRADLGGGEAVLTDEPERAAGLSGSMVEAAGEQRIRGAALLGKKGDARQADRDRQLIGRVRRFTDERAAANFYAAQLPILRIVTVRRGCHRI